MRIDLYEEEDLENLLKTFHKRVNRFKVDKKTGEFIRDSKNKKILNSYRIWHAWEIPLISIFTNELEKVPTYEKIRKINFTGYKSEISLLIGKKWKDELRSENGEVFPTLSAYLETSPLKYKEYREKNVFANKVFVDWMDKIDWSKVKEFKSWLSS